MTILPGAKLDALQRAHRARVNHCSLKLAMRPVRHTAGASAYHVGWKIGENLGERRRARDRILAHGYKIDGMSDHTVSQSLYRRDPDGNGIEP